MLKLLKYMKKSTVPIIAIIALLFIQALCDLSLPDYTSNIVNVGIQQGGVENATPDIIRATEFEKILLFVAPENNQFVLDHYTKISKDSLTQNEYEKYLKKYPAIEREALYKLNKVDKETLILLNAALAKPSIIVYKMS
ncbi:MAG: ABC transporter ATP-binding protein, partial [Oscillospiraceae bacterium]